MFMNPFPQAFGLDIGDRSIKAVQLHNASHRRRHASYDPMIARSTALPDGLIENGIIQEPEKVRGYITHLLHGRGTKEKPIKSAWVAASLPDVQGFIKRIDIDKEPDDIIAEDIQYTAKKHVPFGEEEYYIDWQILPRNGEKTTPILLGAVPKRVADMYTYLLESLGLGVIALEIETLAIARCLITAHKVYGDEARGLLDIGASRSSFTVFDRDQIQFSVSMPFSGTSVTDAIATRLRLPIEEAERRKLAVGLAYSQKDERVWSVISQTVDGLVTHIERATSFYMSHFPRGNRITHITMCGGGSAMKRLDRVLSLKLKTEVRPGHIWKNLRSKKKLPYDDTTSLTYATAIGLALRAADNPFFSRDTV